MLGFLLFKASTSIDHYFQWKRKKQKWYVIPSYILTSWTVTNTIDHEVEVTAKLLCYHYTGNTLIISQIK